MSKDRKPNAKQLRFCQEYMIDRNATQAAIRAGYSDRNPSEQGYALLQKNSVQTELRRLTKEQSERIEYDLDTLDRRLLWESDHLNPDTTPNSRVAALNLLGRRMGAYQDKVDLTGEKETILIELEAPSDLLAARHVLELPGGKQDDADDDPG